VLTIEHNLDVVKTADYLIDLGPEGGDRGGTLVAVGTPEAVAETPGSYTGEYLRAVLADERAHGHMVAADRHHLEELEHANLSVLHDLAQGDRVAVEA
jgi:excinuclease ABC subunit A